MQSKEDIALIKFISLWPRSKELAAKNHEPQRVCYYLIELSSLFHSLWNKGKDDEGRKFIIENNKKLTNSRLCLVKAVALTIRKGLKILSIKPVFEM